MNMCVYIYIYIYVYIYIYIVLFIHTYTTNTSTSTSHLSYRTADGSRVHVFLESTRCLTTCGVANPAYNLHAIAERLLIGLTYTSS